MNYEDPSPAEGQVSGRHFSFRIDIQARPQKSAILLYLRKYKQEMTPYFSKNQYDLFKKKQVINLVKDKKL
jgi:hypothetical protein